MTNHLCMAITLKPKANHHNFATIEEMKEKSKRELLAIPKTGGYFQEDKIVIDTSYIRFGNFLNDTVDLLLFFRFLYGVLQL